MKDDLSTVNTPKYDVFFKLSEKMIFSKKAALGHDLSCIIWKDGIFFPKNMIFFPWEKARDYFSQEIHRNMIFSAYIYGCYRRCVTPLCHKNQRWSYAAKIHLKVIHVLD